MRIGTGGGTAVGIAVGICTITVRIMVVGGKITPGVGNCVGIRTVALVVGELVGVRDGVKVAVACDSVPKLQAATKNAAKTANTVNKNW